MNVYVVWDKTHRKPVVDPFRHTVPGCPSPLAIYLNPVDAESVRDDYAGQTEGERYEVRPMDLGEVLEDCDELG